VKKKVWYGTSNAGATMKSPPKFAAAAVAKPSNASVNTDTVEIPILPVQLCPERIYTPGDIHLTPFKPEGYRL
jgi:hypothetical protein